MLLKPLRYLYTRLMQKKLVGTHDGNFHCDQVLACVMLTKFTKEFLNAEIIRTRNPDKLAECDIVVDVGGRYEPPKLLDHHQSSFTGTYPGFNIRLSSAGLVYLHFPQIIPNVIQHLLSSTTLPFLPIITKPIQQHLRLKLYQNFMMGVDANDNGVQLCDTKPNYTVNSALWNRVGRCNPMWWEDDEPENMDRFRRAMAVAEEEFVAQVRGMLLGGIQTKEIVRRSYQQRVKVHESGQIMVLEKFMPWQGAVFDLEKEAGKMGELKFVMFPERGSKAWRVQAVPAAEGSFALRKGLKEEWRGIKDIPKLVTLSGIHDIVFVHNTGFIGGAGSYESTLKMAIQSL